MLGVELTPDRYLQRCAVEFAKLDLSPFERLSSDIYQAYSDGRFVFICGNGGSGSNASHLCEDLGKSSLNPKDFTNDDVKRLKVLSLTDNKWVILLILNVFFLIIGFFLHSAAAIILVVPIVIPLINAAGIDPVHFGLVVTLNLAIGQQTPPVASVLITACAVARANIWQVTKVNVYFVAVLLAVLLICTYVPQVPLFLVDYFYG